MNQKDLNAERIRLRLVKITQGPVVKKDSGAAKQKNSFGKKLTRCVIYGAGAVVQEKGQLFSERVLLFGCT